MWHERVLSAATLRKVPVEGPVDWPLVIIALTAEHVGLLYQLAEAPELEERLRQIGFDVFAIVDNVSHAQKETCRIAARAFCLIHHMLAARLGLDLYRNMRPLGRMIDDLLDSFVSGGAAVH